MTLYTLIILPNETSTHHLDFRVCVMHLHLKKDHDFEYLLVTKKYIETSNSSSSALANPNVKSSLDT